jgi:hypothetical protein
MQPAGGPTTVLAERRKPSGEESVCRQQTRRSTPPGGTDCSGVAPIAPGWHRLLVNRWAEGTLPSTCNYGSRDRRVTERQPQSAARGTATLIASNQGHPPASNQGHPSQAIRATHFRQSGPPSPQVQRVTRQQSGPPDDGLSTLPPNLQTRHLCQVQIGRPQSLP